MLHLYDRSTMAHSLTLDLDPPLHRLLTDRIAALGEALIDWTEYLVVCVGDQEDDITSCIGLSPLVEPIDGVRYGTPAFSPHWDWLAAHDGYWELQFTFGSTFAYVVIVPDQDGVLPELRRLCRTYAET